MPTVTSNSRIYCFGGYRLDAGNRSLWLRDELVAIPPKSLELLVLLVEHAPNVVTREQILERLWPDTFVEEGNINYTVSQLRKALEIDDAIRTVPRRGYRFDHEITLEVEAALADNAESSSEPHPLADPGFTPQWRLLALPALIVGVFFVASFELPLWPSSAEPAPPAAVRNIRTIAVLPFSDDSADDRTGVRSYILTSAVISRLSLVAGLNVRPIEAVRRLDAGAPVPAGISLSADAVISGALIERPGGLVLDLKLIDVRDGQEVWAEQFAAPEPDSLAFHADVATRIASALMLRLTDPELAALGKRYTANSEAYLLYSQGKALFDRPKPGTFELVLEKYNRATFLDPTFALAHAGLADLFFRRAITAKGVEESNALSLRAEGYARKALELDPQLSEAHTAMGRAHRALRYDYAAAELSFRRAIELDPNNVQAHGFLGQLFILRSDHDAALRMADRIAEIDPRAHAVIFLRYRANEAKRDFEQGLKHAEEAFALDKQVHYARIALASFLFYNGQFERMEAVAREGFDESPGFAFIWHQLLARAAIRNGDMRAAAEHIGELEKEAAHSTKYLYRLAVIYAEQGRIDNAFTTLERCVENREAWAAWMNSEPGFDSIRSDPRFSRLLARMNLSQ